MEVFDGDLLNFKYFVSIFQEVLETKLEDPRGRLTQLIQYTSSEAKDLVKNCIYLPSEEGYRKAMRVLHNRYGDPHKILAAYKKEIKEWPAVKAGNAAGFRRFFNFLVKYKSLLLQNKMNTLTSNPDVICILLQNFQHICKTGRIEKYINSGALMKGKQRTEEVSKRKCPACGKNHDLETCQLYLDKHKSQHNTVVVEDDQNKECNSTYIKVTLKNRLLITITYHFLILTFFYVRIFKNKVSIRSQPESPG